MTRRTITIGRRHSEGTKKSRINMWMFCGGGARRDRAQSSATTLLTIPRHTRRLALSTVGGDRAAAAATSAKRKGL